MRMGKKMGRRRKEVLGVNWIGNQKEWLINPQPISSLFLSFFSSIFPHFSFSLFSLLDEEKIKLYTVLGHDYQKSEKLEEIERKKEEIEREKNQNK